MNNPITLYGADNRPLASSEAGGTATASAQSGRTVTRGSYESGFYGMDSWYNSLSSIGMPPMMRARDPFGNHPWVFAAAMAIANAASQAPYKIFRETSAQTSFLDLFSRKNYDRPYMSKRGKGRRALQRHLQIGTMKRLMTKALEPDLMHPLNDVLLHPNPVQTGMQMFTLTHLWMAVRGEVFWVLENEAGDSLMAGETPARIWPLSPDLFQPIYEYGTFGELIGWYFCPPHYMNKRLEGYRLELPLTDVVQFKNPNPNDPVRGLSRIGAVALTIATDMMAKDYNKSILEHGGDPGGLITYDSDLTPDEEKDYLKRFAQRHEGTSNARRTAMMSGGFAYTPIALAPKDIEFLAMMGWSREEVLAVMGVPGACLGIKDIGNFATALAADKTFWDKTVIPMLQNEEGTLDSTLMFEEPDNVVGAFDLKDVEALRAGVTEKATTAKSLCGTELHMPPKTAYEVVGLEVEPYEGDDTALVPFTLAKLSDVLVPAALPGAIPPHNGIPGLIPPNPTGTPAPALPAPAPAGDSPAQPGQVAPSNLFASYGLARKKLMVYKATRWDQFVKVQSKVERSMITAYDVWIAGERKRVLAAFDEATQGKSFIMARTVDISMLAKLPDIKKSKDALKAQFRPIYTKALDVTFQFTLDDLGGVPVFGIDHPDILNFFQAREKAFTGATPETIRQNLINTLSHGISDGETVQQLRVRVGQVFDIAASDAKALQVARTESASFMNGVRDVMFEEQGFTVEAWSTAGDEHVRDTHIVFGDADSQPADFNYLDLVGESGGQLSYPGDVRCSLASEVVNCRCLKIPIK